MDSRPSGDKKVVRELMRVETDLFDLFIQGKPIHPTAGEMGLVNPDIDTANMAIFEDEYSLEYVRVKSSNEPIDTVAKSPVFFENQDYQLIIRCKSLKKISFYHENQILRESIKRVSDDLLVGSLNFRNEVGLTELVIRVEGIDALRVVLEVFPSKLDYQKDYTNILRDIEKSIYNLAYAFLSRTFQFASVSSVSPSPSLTEFYTLFRSVFNDLNSAIRRIELQPNHNLRREERLVTGERLRRWEHESTKYIRSRPYLLKESELGIVSVNGRSLFPEKGLMILKRQNVDTHENRFVRWMLERIISKVKSVRQKYLELDRVSDGEVYNFLIHAENALLRPIKNGFLRDVGRLHTITPTLALQLSPGYRDVYKLYLLIMKGLHVSSELFRISLKDLASLYEYWCFLQIHEILKNKFELVNEDVVKVHQDGLFVVLDKSRASKFVYRNADTGQTMALFYNSLPDWHSAKMPTVSQRPDTVLTLQTEGQEARVSFIFDAKYKVNPSIKGSEYHGKYGQPGPEEEDINTMHRYRDAIVHMDKLGNYKRTIYGAYVLFPYNDEERYISHRFFKSISEVNIGGLPFLPGNTTLVENLIDVLISGEPNGAIN